MLVENALYRKRLRNAAGFIIKIMVALVVVFPFYWMIATSFKTYEEAVLNTPTLWPHDFTLEHYIKIFQSDIDAMGYFKNSVIITFSVVFLQILVIIPAGYVFARRHFLGKSLFWSVVLIAFMMPGHVTYITTYLLMSKWQLINTLWPQILPRLGGAFGIFMLRQAIRRVPDDVVESAFLDGATEVQVLARIIVPMVKSSLLTIMMFTFIGTWNDYFWPLVMTISENVRPFTMFVSRMNDAEVGINWSVIMASNVVLTMPILVIYAFLHRKIIDAFTYSGIK